MRESVSNSPEQTEQVIDAMLAQVEATLSYSLTPDDRAAVRNKIAQMLQHAAAVLAYPLENHDEPDPIFHPYRAEG